MHQIDTLTPPRSCKLQHYYPVAVATGVSGDLSLIYSMIFSDTGSGKTVEKNSWSAHLSSILLTNTNNATVQDSRVSPLFSLQGCALLISFFLRPCSIQQYFLVFLSMVIFHNYFFCNKSTRSPEIICVRTVSGLIISISCVRLGGCVILEEHPSSPPSLNVARGL